eukprot:12838900-Alexandrium_andersonii.AAC.2
MEVRRTKRGRSTSSCKRRMPCTPRAPFSLTHAARRASGACRTHNDSALSAQSAPAPPATSTAPTLRESHRSWHTRKIDTFAPLPIRRTPIHLPSHLPSPGNKSPTTHGSPSFCCAVDLPPGALQVIVCTLCAHPYAQVRDHICRMHGIYSTPLAGSSLLPGDFRAPQSVLDDPYRAVSEPCASQFVERESWNVKVALAPRSG